MPNFHSKIGDFDFMSISLEHFQNRVPVQLNCNPDLTPCLKHGDGPGLERIVDRRQSLGH